MYNHPGVDRIRNWKGLILFWKSWGFWTRRLKMKDRPIDRILGPHISTPGSCQFIYIYNWCPLFPSSMFFSIYLFLFLIPFPSPIPFLPLPVPFPLSILTLFLLVFWSFSSLSSFFSCFLFLSLSLRESYQVNCFWWRQFPAFAWH